MPAPRFAVRSAAVAFFVTSLFILCPLVTASAEATSAQTAAVPPKPAHKPTHNHETLPGAGSQAFPKWTGVMGRDWALGVTGISVCDRRLKRRCQLKEWRSFLGHLRGKEPALWLDQVNRYVNRVRYNADNRVWGEQDYWAAPGEFFARGGDCEDYAIAKYYSLKYLGVPTERMRIVVLYDKRRKVAHAVLEVQVEGRSMLLDNLHARPVSWRDVTQYRPIYAVNEGAYWLHTSGSVLSAQQADASGALRP